MAVSGPPHPKHDHFPPKNGLNLPMLHQKTVFSWAWVVSSGPPHPILRVLNSGKHVLQGMSVRKCVLRVDPQNKGTFPPKLA